MVAQWDEEADARCSAMRLEGEAKLANIRLLNAAEVKEPKGEASETRTTSIKPGSSLMVVNGEVNEGDARVLIDTGATHNFLAIRDAKQLGIKFTKVDGGLKAINSRATPVHGRAWNVPIRLGKWKGKVDFLVVDMDDESVVLGMEFLARVVPFTVGDGVLTITSGGSKYDIQLATSEEQGAARISTLRAKWKKPRRHQTKVQGRTEHKVPGMKHQQGQVQGRTKHGAHGSEHPQVTYRSFSRRSRSGQARSKT